MKSILPIIIFLILRRLLIQPKHNSVGPVCLEREIYTLFIHLSGIFI